MAENTTIQMFDNTSTPADGVAQIDVPDDGEIKSVALQIAGKNLDVLGDSAEVMLSFASTSSFTVNDARVVIARVGVSVTGISYTSAGVPAQANQNFDFPDGLKVFGGERIHMHTRGLGGGLVTFASAILVFRFRKFTARRR